MMCAENPLSPEEWIDCLEGIAAAADWERLNRHLAGCAACQNVFENLNSSRNRLRQAAREESPDPGPRTLSRLWDSVRFGIRRAALGEVAEAPAADLRQLRSILVSMCGEATAEGALERALPHDARFAENLGSIVEVMCGSRAARFVERAAQSTRSDRAA